MFMNRFLFVIRILVVGIVLAGWTIKSLAQGGVSANAPQGEVVLTKLTEPSYPPLARQTRITGDVELMLEIKEDGTIQSAIVVSGHPLLKQAALDSAQRSRFECQNCGPGVRSYRLLYSFQLGPTKHCTETSDSANGGRQERTLCPRVVHLHELLSRFVGSRDHVNRLYPFVASVSKRAANVGFGVGTKPPGGGRCA